MQANIIEQITNHFGGSFQEIEARWIRDKFGDRGLSRARLHCKRHGISLLNDHVVCPFKILIDSAESQPFLFHGMHQDKSDGGLPIIVPTEWRSLGRFPRSYGDYSIDGFQGRCHVERKSMDDAHGTILGFGDGGRRERFESELSNLAEVVAAGGFACVVVECSFGALLANAPEWGKKSKADNAKSLFRSVMALKQRYMVQWEFCDTRRLAERYTFDSFQMFWRNQERDRKRAAREAMREERERVAEKAKTKQGTLIGVSV